MPQVQQKLCEGRLQREKENSNGRTYGKRTIAVVRLNNSVNLPRFVYH
jgi:hypothetical protein